MASDRKRTKTSAFGTSRREGHDSSAFYERFQPPLVSADSDVGSKRSIDQLFVGDSRSMTEIEDNTVGLVVTSPPYFAGKEYEEALGEGHIPRSYVDYLTMLRDVFSECVRTLEPGGRLAINVANLGRKPYRSLSADVAAILQEDLGLLMRGEIVWIKQRGASGSCAWGSFQRPSNPVLRDLSERILIASKGRFDRAVPAATRLKKSLPSTTTISRDEFMEATTDLWEIAPESATRVGHPAPFPVELPLRLIELYTYAGDLVLDPFVGSGTTAIAALRSGRHYVGYDTDPDYISAANQRIEAADQMATLAPRPPVAVAPGRATANDNDEVLDAFVNGLAAKDVVAAALRCAGFVDVSEKARTKAGLDATLTAVHPTGQQWLFEVAGSLTGQRNGLGRPDVMLRTVGKASIVATADDRPLVVVTPDLPAEGTPPRTQLAASVGSDRPIHAVVVLDESVVTQLRRLIDDEPS